MNDAKKAVEDAKSVVEDVLLHVQASILAGDVTGVQACALPNSLTVTAVDPITGSTHGAVVLAAGQVTYTPAADYNGAASFQYTVRDNGQTAGDRKSVV